MSNGIWTAVSGASAQAHSVEVSANNLANSDTLGFKKDMPSFKEYLATLEKTPEGQPINPGPLRNRDLYPLDGKDTAHVVIEGDYTDFKQGPLKVTQSPLDVAMDGPGFIEVSTPNGIRYTRQGSLKVAMDGRLVTSDGNPVLASTPGGLAAAQTTLANADLPGQGGPLTQGGVAADPNAAARFINLRDRGTNFSISPVGEIYAGDELIAKLSVVEFQDAKKLKKVGAGLFENRDPANLQSGVPQRTVVRQGVVEGSNVNPVEEMTRLIQANRQFEQGMKALKTYGDLLGREANDIGKN